MLTSNVLRLLLVNVVSVGVLGDGGGFVGSGVGLVVGVVVHVGA